MTKRIQKNAGFTLMFAALVASMLMALGMAMFNIAQKEIVLSSIGRDSQFAFYAADAGSECALYWDFQGAFASSTPYTGATCNGVDLGTIGGQPLGTPSEFQFEMNDDCVIVSVVKDSVWPNTLITARGYNTQCADTATLSASAESSGWSCPISFNPNISRRFVKVFSDTLLQCFAVISSRILTDSRNTWTATFVAANTLG
jgi:hypothetical protein